MAEVAAEKELSMLPVRERSMATAATRMYRTTVLTPADRPVTRFKTFVIEEYVPTDKGLLSSEDAPVTVDVSIEIGENPAHIEAPYDPRDYVPRKHMPDIRWVAGPDAMSYRVGGTVSEWFAQQGEYRPPMRAQGQVLHLRSLRVSLPQYYYRGQWGWTPVDALSLVSGASLSLIIPWQNVTSTALSIVGMFDKSDAAPYEVLTIITSVNGRISVGVDSDDTICLTLDSRLLGSCPNPYQPGRLTGLTLVMAHSLIRVLLHTVDGQEGTITASLPEGVYPRADSIFIGGSDRDVEITEASLWLSPDHALLRDQMVETLSYYSFRRLT